MVALHAPAACDVSPSPDPAPSLASDVEIAMLLRSAYRLRGPAGLLYLADATADLGPVELKLAELLRRLARREIEDGITTDWDAFVEATMARDAAGGGM